MNPDAAHGLAAVGEALVAVDTCRWHLGRRRPGMRLSRVPRKKYMERRIELPADRRRTKASMILRLQWPWGGFFTGNYNRPQGRSHVQIPYATASKAPGK